MADMATGTVKHGGRYYAPGELIKGLKAGERKELLAAGAIEVIGGQEESAESGGQKGAGKTGRQKADGKDAGGHKGADGSDGAGEGEGEGGEE